MQFVFALALVLALPSGVVSGGEANCDVRQKKECFAYVDQDMILKCGVGKYITGSVSIGYRSDRYNRTYGIQDEDLMEPLSEVLWKHNVANITRPKNATNIERNGAKWWPVYFVALELRCVKQNDLVKKALQLNNKVIEVTNENDHFLRSPKFPYSYYHTDGPMFSSLVTLHGYGFEIRILKMDVGEREKDSSCNRKTDTLEVTSNHTNNPETGRSTTFLCGNEKTVPGPITVNCDSVEIRLVNKKSKYYNGFVLMYRRIKVSPNEEYCAVKVKEGTATEQLLATEAYTEKQAPLLEEEAPVSAETSTLCVAFFFSSVSLCACAIIFTVTGCVLCKKGRPGTEDKASLSPSDARTGSTEITSMLPSEKIENDFRFGVSHVMLNERAEERNDCNISLGRSC